MREVLVLAWLLALPAGAFAQTGVWQKYTVPETVANVDFPSGIFARDAGRPETGYGWRFMTADGRATLAVESMTNEAKIHRPAF